MTTQQFIKTFLLLLSLTILASCTSIPKEALLFAHKGKSKIKIVIPDSPTLQEIRAAKELAYHLQYSTGSRYRIIRESKVSRKSGYLFVGATKLATQKKLTPTTEEEWVIQQEQNNLFLTGGGFRGTLYATYIFLEKELGVKWWTPWEKSIPLHNTFYVQNLHKRGKPAFSFRNTYALNNPPYEFQKYCARNRLNGAFTNIPAQCGGTINYGDSWDGAKGMDIFQYETSGFTTNKKSPSLAKISEDTQRLISHKLTESIKSSNSEAKSAGLPLPVFYHFSPKHFIDFSKSKGKMDPHYLKMLNNLSVQMKKQYPQIKLETWAYENVLNPCGVKLNDNIAVFVCNHPWQKYSPTLLKPITSQSHSAFRQALQAWQMNCSNLYVTDYAAPLGPGKGLPFPPLKNIAANYRFFNNHNVKGIFSQPGDIINSPFYSMTLWIQAKLMENPNLKYAALANEFIDGYYLEAAPYIREFIALLEQEATKWPITATSPLKQFGYLTPTFLLNANKVLANAEDAIDDSYNKQYRIRQIRISVDYTILLKWQDLVQYQLQQQQTEADLPFTQKEIINRYSDSLTYSFRKWFKGNLLKNRMVWLQNHLKQLTN